MNEQAVHKEQELRDGHILQIFQDTTAESPRSWTNLGTMAIFHKRYNFGDEVKFSSEDFPDWAEMEEYIKKELKAAVVLPIYMYDHSGITIQTEAFACPWDSGQVGFIYVTRDQLREEYHKHNIKEEQLKNATYRLESEVKIMNRYLAGDVYGFHLIKRTPGKEDEILDSCSGFYGDNLGENDMLDYIPKELIPEDLTPDT